MLHMPVFRRLVFRFIFPGRREQEGGEEKYFQSYKGKGGNLRLSILLSDFIPGCFGNIPAYRFILPE